MADDNVMQPSPLTDAATELHDFSTTAFSGAATSISKSLDSAFASLAQNIAKAADSGKISVKTMVESILSDLNRISAASGGSSPVGSLLSYAADSLLPLSGARDAGGTVDAGSAYMVGESGPELFVPSQSGAIRKDVSTHMTFNVQASDANSFLRSESQVSAMMLRALARGKRNL